jgi:hypothetical protein
MLVEPAGTVGTGVHVNPCREHVCGYSPEVPRFHPKAARQQQGWSQRPLAPIKLLIKNEARLISKPLEGAPEPDVFVICTTPPQVTGNRPKELDIWRRLSRAAEQTIQFNLLH